ncbi:MAG: hypothetical protein MJZ25_08865 [Fibrobacter sp.]|nr:hypothetical protein [Fibrobacter sp.]
MNQYLIVYSYDGTDGYGEPARLYRGVVVGATCKYAALITFYGSFIMSDKIVESVRRISTEEQYET